MWKWNKEKDFENPKLIVQFYLSAVRVLNAAGVSEHRRLTLQ